MKLSKEQREQHSGAARDLIVRLEARLSASPPARSRAVYGRHLHEGQRIAECVSAYKAQLESNPRDGELLRINLELADLFYRTCNASKRGHSSF